MDKKRNLTLASDLSRRSIIISKQGLLAHWKKDLSDLTTNRETGKVTVDLTQFSRNGINGCSFPPAYEVSFMSFDRRPAQSYVRPRPRGCDLMISMYSKDFESTWYIGSRVMIHFP